MEYAQRQALIVQRAQRWAAERPDLDTRLSSDGRRKRSGVAVAAANARRILAEQWPDAVVSVKSHKHAHGTEVSVCILGFPNHPSAQAVREVLAPFLSRRWNVEQEDYDCDQDIDREGFRRAFGGCGEMHVSILPPSPAEVERYMRKRLAPSGRSGSRPRM